MSFSGAIPEGQYGAGEVFIWDKGIYEPVSISENRIVFNINGEKLKGEYCLVKKVSGKGQLALLQNKEVTLLKYLREEVDYTNAS